MRMDLMTVRNPTQYPMWGGTGPRFGESGPRNKWFHKAAPDPTLTRQIERTREFAKTLRQSPDQRLWSAKYPAPVKPSMYRSAPDLSLQTQPTIPDNKDDRARFARSKHRLSLRGPRTNSVNLISTGINGMYRQPKRSRSLASNAGDRSRRDLYSSGGKMPMSSKVYGGSTSSLVTSSSLISLPEQQYQPSYNIVISKPVKLQDRAPEYVTKSRNFRGRTFSRSSTQSSRSSINLRIGGRDGD